ncbi:hypothetical protein BCR33DRAFT_569741 [Rhizoclosmatium globosum]|uniref:Uncharacterized protein n=1 Tax=Rhizoclosmatium globosum TaxID=329046 RepID=A0A1Y2B5L3_9FUNG|nr:hypothetical protein BCR33DRAFT_569741 [Rhizoclosmatium globosum]|eukprot:ORY30128.1 hypothetical protein BCR33DRAFT_569741 [Rhizoclosmatium globosum]
MMCQNQVLKHLRHGLSNLIGRVTCLMWNLMKKKWKISQFLFVKLGLVFGAIMRLQNTLFLFNHVAWAKCALLPSSQNVGFNQFSLLTPEERGNPTFSPEWKASQIVGMNSFDHPFLEIDGDVIKLKLSADVQIHFFEYDIKSVVLHHTTTESSIYITLAHPPIIADTSVITTMSYADMKKATFSRVPKVNTKHSFFVFNCLVCRITFHPSRTDTVASVFSRIGPAVQSPVLIAPGGLYATKHQEALKKLMSSLPLIIAHQLTIIWTWSIMFPTELVAFTKNP